MVEEIEIVLLTAEAKTGDVPLLACQLGKKRERITAHSQKRAAGENGARDRRLGGFHLRAFLAAKLFLIGTDRGHCNKNSSALLAAYIAVTTVPPRTDLQSKAQATLSSDLSCLWG